MGAAPLSEEVGAQLLLQLPVAALEAPGDVVGQLEEGDHADGVGALQPALESETRAPVEERPEVQAHDVVRQALRHHEEPPVELLGVDRVDAVGVVDEAADLAVDQLLPGGAARVAVAVEAGRQAAHAAHGLLQHGHVAADAPEALAKQTEGTLLRLLLVQAQDLADAPERGGVDAVGQQPGVAVGAAVVAVAGRDGTHEALGRPVPAGDRVGARREQAAVIVGAAREPFAPGRLAVRLDAVALGHRPERLGRERRGDGAQQAVAAARPGAVAALQDVEEEEHALHRLRGEPPGHVEERVREVVGDAGLAQAGHEVVDVLACPLDLGERRLVEAERDDVQRARRPPGTRCRTRCSGRCRAGGRSPASRPGCCGR